MQFDSFYITLTQVYGRVHVPQLGAISSICSLHISAQWIILTMQSVAWVEDLGDPHGSESLNTRLLVFPGAYFDGFGNWRHVASFAARVFLIKLPLVDGEDSADILG